ncbi:MAG: TlpA disulfide reductase family protein [Bacteroidota bacterium]
MQYLHTKQLVITTFFLLFALMLFAQPNTLVMGKIKNARVLKTIELRINKLYLNNAIDVYTSRILDDQTFAFAVEVTEPQVAILEYARNQGTLYLEPNDTLWIDCDAHNFQYSFEFSMGLGEENDCWNEYTQRQPRALNLFSMVRYKQKKYWYENSPQMDKAMLAKTPPQFEAHLQSRLTNARSILEKHQKKTEGVLSEDFQTFFQGDILYEFAYHKMLYGHVFRNRYSIQAKYFDFLDDIPIQSKHLGSEWYREFLLAYFDHQNYKQTDDARSPYIFQYEEGSKVLTNRTAAFFQSEIIARAFRAKQQTVILEKYWDYMRHQDYGDFDTKVTETYAKAIKFANGTLAPQFSITDIENNLISLEDYRGKVVYLNFWATWCRPCMNKMKTMKSVQRELEGQDIIFLNVSLDRNEETWKEILEQNDFKGIHALASGELNSDIAKAYEVKVLPLYFIIDQTGVFVKNPKINTPEKIKQTLLGMVH